MPRPTKSSRISDLQSDNAVMLTAGRDLVDYLLALARGAKGKPDRARKAAMVFAEGEGLKCQMVSARARSLMTLRTERSDHAAP